MNQRCKPYQVTGWYHLVAIADRMCRDDALDLEERLFRTMQADKRDVLYRKYDNSVRDGPYRRSAGGVTGGEDQPIHGVYMAWCGLSVD